jgi:hypothetical protein
VVSWAGGGPTAEDLAAADLGVWRQERRRQRLPWARLANSFDRNTAGGEVEHLGASAELGVAYSSGAKRRQWRRLQARAGRETEKKRELPGEKIGQREASRWRSYPPGGASAAARIPAGNRGQAR